MKDKIYNILKEYCIAHNIIPEKRELKRQNWFEIANNILKEININDLYIEPIINDIDKIKFLRNKKTSKFFNSNVELNTKYQESVCKNIKTLTFYSLYPTLIIKLVDNNIMKIENVNHYTLFKYLFINRAYFKNTDMYYIIKIFTNYFYGIYYSDKTFENFNMYRSFLYQSFKNLLKDNLIYYDTDTVYYFDDNYTFNYDLPYEIEELKEFIIFRKKKCIEIDNNNNIKYKGFRQVNKSK